MNKNKNDPAADKDTDDRCPECKQISEASFTHVREVHQFFAELRSKNFDFYLILLGGCAAGYVTQDEQSIKFASSIAAAVISLIFWGLDIRTRHMIGGAREELQRIEPFFGVNLHGPDAWTGQKSKRSRWINHRTLYTIVFVLAFLTSVGAAYQKYPFKKAAPDTQPAVVVPNAPADPATQSSDPAPGNDPGG